MTLPCRAQFAKFSHKRLREDVLHIFGHSHDAALILFVLQKKIAFGQYKKYGILHVLCEKMWKLKGEVGRGLLESTGE